MNSKKKDKNREIDTSVEDWINLVHGGTCCAMNDPHEAEKELFISKLPKKSDK